MIANNLDVGSKRVTTPVSNSPVILNTSSASGVSNNSSSYSTGDNYINQMLQLQRQANEANIASARETSEFNAKEAQKNRDWQEMMSNTAHQREVKDLMAAGLNPILSAMGGNGASVTSGSTASGSKATVESGINAMANIISSSINANTQLEIAKLNNATSVSNQDKYVDALVANGILSSDTAKANAKLSSDTNLEIAKGYQSNQTKNNVLNNVMNLAKGVILYTIGDKFIKNGGTGSLKGALLKGLGVAQFSKPFVDSDGSQYVYRNY